MAIERTSVLASLGEVTAVGDTEDAEEAVSSLSALILNRNFEGSLGADDLRPKNDLPPVVGESVGADEEVPLRPAVCIWGTSLGSMTSEGRRNDCEGDGRSSTSTIMGSTGAGPFFCFFGDGSSSSSSISSIVTALVPLRVVDDPFWKDGNDDCFGGGLGDCEGESTELVSGDPLVEADKRAGGRDLLLP